MPKTCYTPKRFSDAHQAIIDRANQIVTSYRRQGYDLTLRQLYYQFVSRDWFPKTWADKDTGSTNNEKSYKKLGGIISDARRAGLIDWDAIVDRTRNVHRPSAWGSPADIVASVAEQFAVDWWMDQTYRPEVWVEKDALLGVIEVACAPWHCSYFACRGYTSDSEIWSAAQRLKRQADRGQTPIVIHLGDHDPSGIDMTRDILDRLKLFSRSDIEVRRIALNMQQVRELNPPPNPAKSTDARYKGYQEQFGEESWELDALNPEYITNLIAEQMEGLVDQDAWTEAGERQAEGRRLLQAVSDDWERITDGI